MRKITPLLAVCGLAVLVSCGWSERQTRNRITIMMEGWEKGGTSSSGHMQEAVSMWYDGSRFIADDVVLSRASAQFDDWRRQKGLYGDIRSWKITSITEIPDPMLPAMDVEVEINGKPYRLRVASDVPIEWAG